MIHLFRIVSGILLLILVGCTSIPTKPITTNHESKEKYYVKLRLVIETLGEKCAVPYEDVIENLNGFTDSFCDPSVELIVYTIEFVEMDIPYKIHIKALDEYLSPESKLNDEYINIYYLMPRHVYLDIPTSGYIASMGSLPDNDSHYVFIVPYFADKFIFAHEIGHCAGGLLHTFDTDDFCEDTPEQLAPNIDGYNIMDYSGNPIREFTDNQRARFKQTLLDHHANRIVYLKY